MAAWAAPRLSALAARRAASLLAAGAVAGAVLLFSQRYFACFPQPKQLALAALVPLAWAFAAAAGIRPRLEPFSLPLLAVLAWLGLSLVRTEAPEAAARLGLPVAAAAALAWLAAALGRHPAERGRLVAAFVLAHLACGAYGVLQYAGADPLTWTVDYGPGRVFSSLGNPNFLAGQMALALPVLAALGSAGAPGPRWIARSAFLASLVAFVCAQTRGAWLGLAAGLAAAAALRRTLRVPRAARWLLPATGAVLLWASVPALNPTDISVPSQLASSANLEQPSARQRFYWWRASALLLRAGPIAGHGAGGFVREFPARAHEALGPYADLPPAYCDHPHNDYLFIACEHGVIGLGLLLWLGATWIRTARAAWRRGDPLGPGSLAGAVAVAGHAVFNMPATIEATLATAALLLGLGAARARPAPPPAAPGTARLLPLAAGLAAAVTASWRPGVLLQAQAYLNDARVFHARGASPVAAWSARQALALTDAPWRGWFLLGSALYARGQWTAALEAFRADERENPWGADAILHQGKVLRQMGRDAEADAEARRALALVPNYADAAVTIASLAYARAVEARKAGRPAEMRRQLARARIWLTYALRYLPRHAESLKLLGFVELLDGRWDAVEAAWRASLQARPTDDALRHTLDGFLRDRPRLEAGGRSRW